MQNPAILCTKATLDAVLCSSFVVPLAQLSKIRQAQTHPQNMNTRSPENILTGAVAKN